jgi:hypothetical protein
MEDWRDDFAIRVDPPNGAKIIGERMAGEACPAYTFACSQPGERRT